MKKFILVFLVASFSGFVLAQNLAISPDAKQGMDNNKPSGDIVQVHYDGPNWNAIGDGGITFIGAVKLMGNLFDGLIGGSFESVDVYFNDMPDSINLWIWDHTNDSIPGAVIEMQSLGTNVVANSWNTYSLNTPITIPGPANNIWIGGLDLKFITRMVPSRLV
jgi:hypothetical protein